MNYCVVIVATLLTGSAIAGTLNQWLVEQVRSEERLLSDALSQVNGQSLDLLKDSKTYVPFFLEVPQQYSIESADQKSFFNAWVKNNEPGFLSGGYIYRLTFRGAPPLFALSAGEWSGNTWHSLALGMDLRIDPNHTWEAVNGDFLYATFLGGAPPRIIVYDLQGEMQRQEVFDMSTEDLEQRVEVAVSAYTLNGTPALEMISMAEYLESQDVSWREVDLSGEFNLRNQQQRPDEQERLKLAGQLTRSTALNALQSISARDKPSETNPPPVVQFNAPETKLSPTTLSENLTSSKTWSVVGALIAAAIAMLWVLLVKRK